MSTSISRRRFLGHGIGFGSLLVAACGTRDVFARDSPRMTGGVAPTPAIPDDDPLPDVEPIPARDTSCTATADNIEGPFYKPGAPSRATFVREHDRGERLVLSGTVRTTGCQPVEGATLDIWHADERGDYDDDGYTYRGTLATDATGRWSLRTIVPGRYLNGRRYRPSHIHVKIRARGHETLTTQLYFEGDPYLEGDPFVVSSLVMPHRRAGGVRRAAFDFVVA